MSHTETFAGLMIEIAQAMRAAEVIFEVEPEDQQDQARHVVSMLREVLKKWRAASGITQAPPINQEMLSALKQIANPIAAMQADAEREGSKLNGQIAVQLSEDHNYLKEIARKAISKVEAAVSQESHEPHSTIE